MKRRILFACLFALLAFSLSACSLPWNKPSMPARSVPAAPAAPVAEEAPAAETEELPSNVSRFENNFFLFNYRNDILTPTSTADKVILESQYFITDNLSGRPKGETIYPFAIELSMSNLPLEETAAVVLPYAVKNIFPKGTRDSFEALPGQNEMFEVDGFKGYGYNQGLEGVGEEYVFVPASEKETLVVKFSYFDKSVFDNPPSSADYSLSEQRLQFQFILNTLRFIR